MFKDKLVKRIEEKEQERELKQIIYPEDKPTFPTDTMDSAKDHPVIFDETNLLQQAQAIQAKLLQFNVPIAIE